MGEKIEFPTNEQFYKKKADEALNKQQIEEAIDLLEKGFLQTNSSKLLEMLSNLLQKQEEWSELLWLFDEEYLCSKENPGLYYDSLLHTQNFERLETELQQIDGTQFPEKQYLELKLKKQKLVKQQQELEQLTSLQVLLNHPERVLLYEESYYYCQWLVQSSLIEKELFFEKILLDSRFSLLDKAIIIDSWVIEGKLPSLQMLRGTEVVVLDKSRLVPLSSHEWLQNPLEKISAYLEDSQFEIATLLEEKLKQDVIRLYPFEKESIGSLQEWVSYFANQPDLLETFSQSDEQLLVSYQHYKQWQSKSN